MFNWFRSGTPYTFLLLALYTLVVKCYYFLHPMGAVMHAAGDGLLYRWLVDRMANRWNETQTGFTFLAQGILFVQALSINSMVNHYRVFPKTTYFPAMCFLLFSSFMPGWNYFSAPLIAGLGMVWVCSRLIRLYITQSAREEVFNIGLAIGLLAMIYLPCMLFLLLLWAALLINRPFRIVEWIIAILGILCPFYFMAVLFFLTGRWPLLMTERLLPVFDIPRFTQNYRQWIALGMLLLPLLYGAFRVQQHFFKLLIQIRKIWLLLGVYFFVVLLLSFTESHFSLDSWILLLLPAAIYQANACWHIHKNIVGNSLHAFFLAVLLVVEWMKW